MRKILNIVNTIYLLLVMLWGLSGLLYEIIGPVKFESVLYVVHPALTFGMFCKVGYIILAVLIGSYYVKNRI